MEMRNRQDRREISLNDEKHAEWKPVEDGPPVLAKHPRKAQRAFFDSREGCAKFDEECRSEAVPLTVVPSRRLEEIEFRFRPNVQPKHLPTGTQTLLNSLDDLLPGPCFIRRPAMRGEALRQERLLPLLQRNLVDVRRNVIPQRLDVLNLVFNRERVESRRRQRQRI
jgi:hypothetical protein